LRYYTNMNKKPLLISVLIAVLVIIPAILFLTNRPESTPEQRAAKVQGESERDPTVTKTYSGIVPCADCAGIETTISLTQENKDAKEGNYTMSLIYIGQDGDAVILKGTWKTEKGRPGNPDATVISLSMEKPEDVGYYLQRDPAHLVQLDKDKNTINDSGQNSTLTLM